MRTWDVVVVGGGGSGAVLAARLSEDPSRRVLLLEAGPAPRRRSDFPRELLDARRVPGADAAAATNWRVPGLLTPDRPWTVTRGRVLGGSTTTNGGYFVRPRDEDLARWAAVGGPLWDPAAVLRWMCALERDLDLGEQPGHGSTGPVPVQRPSLASPVAAAFVEAALDRGHGWDPDKNGPGPGGVGPVPANVVDGVRVNTGLAYVLPALGRPNLAVLGDAVVRRVLLRDGAALGCEVEVQGRTERVLAGEVVLAAGAVGSAHLLLLSGIGPPEELRAHGLTVVHAAAVGRVSDHPQAVLSWQPRVGLPVHSRGTWAAAAVHASPDGGPPSGDVEVLLSLAPLAALAGGTARAEDPLPLLVSSVAPVVSGRLRLRSADPRQAPLLEYGYLAGAVDRRRMRAAVRTALDLLEAGPFREVGDGLVGLDARTIGSDADLDAWLSRSLSTSFHTCGTAPFGPEDDPRAVVAPDGRVHGVRGLRVADTSILPTAPLRGPALSAVLVGEVVAGAVREG